MASFLGLARLLLLSIFLSTAVAGGIPATTKCRNPRVRKEWRQLSTSQRADWIKAVNCLAKLPHDPRLTPSVPANVSLIPPVNTSTSFYDDIVYLHMDLNHDIHFTGQFLPWHRFFTHYFEDSLINRCGYKGATPYWNWTIDAHDVYNSPFFDNSSTSGLGGWGDPKNDFQIYTGGFKDQIRSYPNPHHIRRNFSNDASNGNSAFISPFAGDPNAPSFPPGFLINTTMVESNVDYLINNFEGDFIGFHSYLDSFNGIHPGAHIILGGDMTGFCSNGAAPPTCVPGTKWTPNDPLFFMHHAMIDKVWYDWQHKSSRNFYSFGGGSVPALGNFSLFTIYPTGLPPYVNFDTPIPGDGLWNATIWDAMDTTGDTLCYIYA